MSYDAYSYAVYGKKITKDEMSEVKLVRSCTHQTDLNRKFCSECGKPVYRKEKHILLEDENNGMGFFLSDHERSSEGIVGFKLGMTGNYGGDEYCAMEMPTQQMKNDLVEFLGSHKISFDESQFKMYVFTRHSY